MHRHTTVGAPSDRSHGFEIIAGIVGEHNRALDLAERQQQQRARSGERHFSREHFLRALSRFVRRPRHRTDLFPWILPLDNRLIRPPQWLEADARR